MMELKLKIKMNHDKAMEKTISAHVCIVNTVDRNQEMPNTNREILKIKLPF